MRLDPDEAVSTAIRTVFERFTEVGSVRRVWLWFRSEELLFPFRRIPGEPIRWVKPTYLSIHHVLSNAVYAGAYTYGKTRQERYLDGTGRVRQRTRHLPRSEWGVLIPDHHPGYITWESYLANQERIGANTRPRRHEAGGAVREGTALLQGLAVCGRCGRRLLVSYHGRNATPGYYCAAGAIVNGHGSRCLRVGGQQIDAAVATAFLVACTPAGVQAALAAAQRLEADHDAALAQARLAVERSRYEATRAERRYRAVDAENRLVARGLEREWDERLQAVAATEAELAAREHRRPRGLTSEERELIDRLGNDLEQVWTAPTTSARDQKELLRTLLAEVIVKVDRPAAKAELTLRWRGGALTDLVIPLPRSTYRPLHTDEKNMVAPPPTRRSLSGSTDCQHSQSSGSPERTRRAIHRAISRWPTYLPAHPTLPTADRPAGWTTGDGGRSRPSVGCGSIHVAPLASGWLHWRRAAHSGRSMADPPHRRIAGSLHRRGTSWVAPDVGNHESPGRLASVGVAACQARPVAGRTRPPWTPAWTTYRSADDHSRPLRTTL